MWRMKALQTKPRALVVARVLLARAAVQMPQLAWDLRMLGEQG
jgi:hypothetical protein